MDIYEEKSDCFTTIISYAILIKQIGYLKEIRGNADGYKKGDKLCAIKKS